MPWLELTIQTKETYAERISDFLEQAAAVSITWKAADEEALFEPDLDTTPLWQRVSVSALFLENTATTDLINNLQREFGQEAILDYRLQTIPDKEWERVWLNDFQVMRFGQRLWVCPTAFEPPDPSGIIVRLDPGLAFGTGTHPSTALCLEWIEAHIQLQQTVIDYGCGSGILAIAALKCGAKEVFAIDHDVQALEATRANTLLNSISAEKIKTLLPHQCPQHLRVDVLIANILAKPLLDLAKDFKNLIKKEGCCVLAGILSEQVESVLQHYVKQGFTLLKRHDKQNWSSMVMRLSS